MKAVSFLVLTTGALMAAYSPAKDDPSKDDTAQLRGTWVTVSLVNNGKTLIDERTPAQKGPATKLVYVGNKWMIQVGDRTVASGIFTADATKRPKEIDIMDESGTKNEKTKLGIYEVHGDTYK